MGGARVGGFTSGMQGSMGSSMLGGFMMDRVRARILVKFDQELCNCNI